MGVEEQRNQKYIEMTTGNLRPLICKLAVPTIISMLITSFYNMADTYFMGQINKSATGAIGVVFSLMAIIQAIGFFFGHGCGNYMSRKLGDKDTKSAEEMASVGFVSAVLCGVVISIVGLVFLEPLGILLGSTDTILPFTLSYMSIILLGAPFMTSSLVLNTQLRFQGSAFFAMIGMGSGAVLNILLDPLFIFVFDMGISGAAYATLISQVVSFVLLLAGTAKSSAITIRLKNFKPSAEKYKAIVQGGMPSLSRQGISSVANIMLNNSMRIYGDAAFAAMSIVMRITWFMGAALIGFGQGFQPVCGYNYGAKKYDRVKQAFWFSVKVTTAATILLSVAAALLATPIISEFANGDKEVIDIGVFTLRLHCMSMPVTGFVILSNMMLQNINKYVSATILALARQGLFLIPLLLILPLLLGFLGIQLSQPVADVLAFALSLPLTMRVLGEMKKQQKELLGKATK